MNQPEAQPTPTKSAPMQDRAARTVTTLLVGRLLCDGEPDRLCRIRNISSGGMMVEAPQVMRVGAALTVELRNGERLSGRVVWNQVGRAGVQFHAPLPAGRLELLARINARQQDGPQPRAPRFITHCPSLLTSNGRRMAATVLNISQSGAGVRLPHPHPLVQQVSLSLPGLPVRQCMVRWSHEDQAGLSFVECVPFHELATWLNLHARMH